MFKGEILESCVREALQVLDVTAYDKSLGATSPCIRLVILGSSKRIRAESQTNEPRCLRLHRARSFAMQSAEGRTDGDNCAYH